MQKNKQSRRGHFFSIIVFFAAMIFAGQVVKAQVAPKITPEEFSRLVITMSEFGGYFSSDNWVSNETSFLNAIEPIERLNIHGGVYIGVASNQNFTYIAAIKPDLAFFVDIRHLNRMQHLVYKIIFEKAETRAEFFSLLFSKPLDPNSAPGEDAGIDSIVEYFYSALSSRDMFEDTLIMILDALTNKYKFTPDTRDISSIRYVLDTFFIYNLNITYNASNSYNSTWPTLARLLMLTDFRGKQLNAFNSRESYLFLRRMQLENRIIPLTGDFAGTKALTEVAKYLKQYDLTVSAYYVSNVERYLFRDNVFSRWVVNVKKLPITDRTVFIRWTHDGNWMYSQETRLQWMKTFINNYDSGRYFSYEDLKYFDYIK